VTSPVPASLAATLKNLPDRPGVYLMKNSRGDVLYVGKAQSLRSRVRSYWQKEAATADHHLIRSVIDRVVDVEYTITDSTSEALLLEGNLVKRFQPQYNVRHQRTAQTQRRPVRRRGLVLAPRVS
jgi:excinuclease ABC subunit C